MPITTFGNNPSTTIAANGYAGAATADTPSGGTSEAWTFASLAGFPGASNSAVPPTQFHIADVAQPGELLTVTNIAGLVGTVTRGAEGTTPVSHAAGATFYQIISGGDLTAMKQASGAITSPISLFNSSAETVLCTYQPVSGEISAGTTFELVATGTIATSTTAPVLTFTLRWGGLGGTSILAIATGTNCPAMVSTIAAGSSFDVNGTVTFIDATHAVANLNLWWQKTTTTYTGVASSGASVAVTGSGPLVLTAKWGTAQTSNSLVVPAPLVYRAC